MSVAPVIEGAAGAPLGNNTDFAVVSSPAQVAEAVWAADPAFFNPTPLQQFAAPELTPEGNTWTNRALSWLSLSHGRRLLASKGLRFRVAGCGLQIAQNHRVVKVYRSPDRATGKALGVCKCGQTLCCPVCAPRVSALRAEEVAHGFRNAYGMGWEAWLVTLTAPHLRDSALMDEALWWRDSWRWAFSSGHHGANRAKEDWLGYVTATEMNWSERGGWHYHRHLLLYVTPGMGALAVQMMRARWLAAIRRGHRDAEHVERYSFGAEPCNSDRAAYYCQKIGAEVSSPTTKGSGTPLAWLRAAAKAGLDAPQWVEALQVCTALKIGSCRWSRGLRAALHLPTDKTDEELAEEQQEQGDELLGCLTPAQWQNVIHHRLEYRLLQVAQEGAEALTDFLQAHDVGELWSPLELARAESVSE